MPGFADYSRFYLADIGYTWELSVTDSGVATPEKLLPGRYLVQIRELSSETSPVWMKLRRFSDAAVSVTAEAPSFPFNRTSGVMVVEFNVRRNYNDQIQLITPAGITATASITKISSI